MAFPSDRFEVWKKQGDQGRILKASYENIEDAVSVVQPDMPYENSEIWEYLGGVPSLVWPV